MDLAIGPSVYLQAALHAHEMPGVVALDRLIPKLENAEKEGRLLGNITIVPHANPVGLSQSVFGETLGRFDFNERVNFNRSFPTKTRAFRRSEAGLPSRRSEYIIKVLRHPRPETDPKVGR